MNSERTIFRLLAMLIKVYDTTVTQIFELTLLKNETFQHPGFGFTNSSVGKITSPFNPETDCESACIQFDGKKPSLCGKIEYAIVNDRGYGYGFKARTGDDLFLARGFEHP
jgi:hypothetical protein